MHFVVIGAGSLGSVYGGNLARVGEQVTFLDPWTEHVAAIETEGLQMEGLTGSFRVRCRAATSPAVIEKADAVLVCVNAYDTLSAAASAKMVLQPDGYCLTLQNGVGNVETLVGALGEGRVLAGLSFQSGDLAAPGRARHTNNGPTYLGEIDLSRSPRLQHLTALFQDAGMNPVLVEDISATIWEKFIHNCGINAICALTQLRPGHIHEVAELDRFQTAIIRETLAAIAARGTPIPQRDYEHDIKEYCAHKFHRPSMMQHLERGRRTEIDALNGWVAAESERLGLAAPYNQALTQLIKGREHRPSTASDEAI